MRFSYQLVLLTAIVGCTGAAQNQISNDPPVPTAAASPDDSSTGQNTYTVKLETSKGDVIIEVDRDLAPQGAKRFHELVQGGFYDECRFFRVLPDFMVQTGINGDPEVQAKWRDSPIPDDPVRVSNRRGYVTFATSGPNSRTTQFFISTRKAGNSRLDADGFAPFGRVTQGMDVVDAINAQYGEKPDQQRIQYTGNDYLNTAFPELDYIKKATIVGGE